MKLTKLWILASVALMLFGRASNAQTVTQHPTTDSEKIADTLSAGPPFITKDATILDWPATPGSEYRVLRKGTNEWTCLPAVPGYPHDEPGCFDRVFMQWMKDGLAGRTPRINAVGIAYMYKGAFVRKPGETDLSKSEFHVGPHIMIVSPRQDELQAFSAMGPRACHVTHLPNRTELFLVIPIRQWDEKLPTN
jgi:hypothetical protein